MRRAIQAMTLATVGMCGFLAFSGSLLDLVVYGVIAVGATATGIIAQEHT